jgi:catechol 2,3-dioxygenase-like lactoylglutathione lyase family enzyme
VRIIRFIRNVGAAALLLAASIGVAQTELEPARFHHVHLNVTDPAATAAYYIRVHGAVPTRYRDRVDALFTERSFILWNRVAETPPNTLRTGVWHIGWGAVDVTSRYRWFQENDVPIYTEFYTLGRTEITYLEGPDGEIIEVNTMPHHRFGHVHLLAADVNATVDWYVQHLGVTTAQAHAPKPDLREVRAWSRSFRIDNVLFIVYNQPDYEPVPPWWKGAPLLAFESTRGTVVDHLAFSYRDADAALERMRRDGVTIVEPVRTDPEFGHRSFFVEGPERVLIEIIEAKPIPESSWE